jgi:hypothetical protein
MSKYRVHFLHIEKADRAHRHPGHFDTHATQSIEIEAPSGDKAVELFHSQVEENIGNRHANDRVLSVEKVADEPAPVSAPPTVSAVAADLASVGDFLGEITTGTLDASTIGPAEQATKSTDSTESADSEMPHDTQA